MVPTPCLVGTSDRALWRFCRAVQAVSLALTSARQSLDKLSTEINRLEVQGGKHRGAEPRAKLRGLLGSGTLVCEDLPWTFHF